MRSAGSVDIDREKRRQYFEDGIREFRALLEREFKRTHPGGLYNSQPPPPGYVPKIPDLHARVIVKVR